MTYKYSKGERKFDDITAENDAEGDTKINFEEDYIALEAAGSPVLVVSGSTAGIGTATPSATEILTLSHTNPTILFRQGATDVATIGINASNNILLQNDNLNSHIVLKVKDGATTKEGLRVSAISNIDGNDDPEVVINEGQDSLLNFRVESANNTHMLYVDGANDRVGINTATPSAALDVVGDVKVSGQITAATQPAFLARKPSNNQDQFAVDSGVDVTLSVEDFDVGSNFASNTFTAPTTGVYIFTANIYLTNLDTDANSYSLDLVTTAGTYRLATVDPGGFSNDLTQYILGGSIPVSLAAGDTAKIQVYQTGGTQQTNIRGAGTKGTFFAGYLLG